MEPTEQLADILPALNETVGQIRTDLLDAIRDPQALDRTVTTYATT